MDIPLRLMRVEQLKRVHLERWLENRDVNPITDKRIKIGSEIYNKLWKRCREVIGDDELQKMGYSYDGTGVRSAPPKARKSHKTRTGCKRKWINYDSDETQEITGTCGIPCRSCGARKWFAKVHVEAPTCDSIKCPDCSGWLINRWYCNNCRERRQ